MPANPQKPDSLSPSKRMFYEAQAIAERLLELGVRWREIEDIAHMLVSIARTESRAAMEAERRK